MYETSRSSVLCDACLGLARGGLPLAVRVCDINVRIERVLINRIISSEKKFHEVKQKYYSYFFSFALNETKLFTNDFRIYREAMKNIRK